MNDKEELFVEGKEGEEDLLDFEFEELPEDSSEIEDIDEVAFDGEILELTDIISPGDVGSVGEGKESAAGGEFDFDVEELGADSIDFDDEEIADRNESEELSLGDYVLNTDGKDKSEEQIDLELDSAFDSIKKQEDSMGDGAGVDGQTEIEGQNYKNGLFQGSLSDIPEIDDAAVTDVGGGVQVSDVGEEPGQFIDELVPIDEDEPEPEPEDLDLGAMIDEIEKEEIEAESEELPLHEIGEEIEEEPEPETPVEDSTQKPFYITDELVPESIELEDEPELPAIDKEKLEEIITDVVKNVVEKAVKESMSVTAEKVIRETINALKSSMGPEEEE